MSTAPEPPTLNLLPVCARQPWYRAGLGSALIHASAALVLFTAFSSEQVRTNVLPRMAARLTGTDLAPYLGALKRTHGGGGGGDRSPLPASKGVAPRIARVQFTPPAAVIHNEQPRLAMPPTIVAEEQVKLPEVKMNVWGDPFAKLGPLSSGPGSESGIGDGRRGGVGPGDGPGIGPGAGGGVSDVYGRLLPGVSPPVPIFMPEPDYSEEARKARFQGTVVLSILVDERGMPSDIKVVQSLGLGLDQKAMEAVRKWRFKPGTRNGRPVAVTATVYVSFHLL